MKSEDLSKDKLMHSRENGVCTVFLPISKKKKQEPVTNVLFRIEMRIEDHYSNTAKNKRQPDKTAQRVEREEKARDKRNETSSKPSFRLN